MKYRDTTLWSTNQRKLSNNMNVELSDEKLLTLMIEQFNSQTNINRDNVLLIKSEEIFQPNIVNKLEKFLKKKYFVFSN